jgi:hypothetical protein
MHCHSERSEESAFAELREKQMPRGKVGRSELHVEAKAIPLSVSYLKLRKPRDQAAGTGFANTGEQKKMLLRHRKICPSQPRHV